MSYRIFSVGQATKTRSSPQFSGFTTTGRGTISILWAIGATGFFGINPFSMAGSPTDATWATEPGRVPFPAAPWSIADGPSADAAGALACAPALLGTLAPGMPKDGARPGDATLAFALKEPAGLRTGAGVRTTGSWVG